MQPELHSLLIQFPALHSQLCSLHLDLQHSLVYRWLGKHETDCASLQHHTGFVTGSGHGPLAIAQEAYLVKASAPLECDMRHSQGWQQGK